EAKLVTGEAAKVSRVVVFDQLGALLEEVGHFRDGERDRDEKRQDDGAGGEEGDHPEAGHLPLLRQESKEAHQEKRENRHAPGGTGEGEEHREQEDEKQD